MAGFPGQVFQERDGQVEAISPTLESHTVPPSLYPIHYKAATNLPQVQGQGK